MRRRSARRDDAVKVRAAICSRFGVTWHRYGELTVRERRVLVDLIVAEDGDTTTPGGRPGYERVGEV